MSDEQAGSKQDLKALRKSLLDQLEENKKAIDELSDDELESVAGGVFANFVNVNTGVARPHNTLGLNRNTGVVHPHRTTVEYPLSLKKL